MSCIAWVGKDEDSRVVSATEPGGSCPQRVLFVIVVKATGHLIKITKLTSQ